MTKKTFKDDSALLREAPALLLVSPEPQDKPVKKKAETKPAPQISKPSPDPLPPLKPNPAMMETKSRRLQLLIKPSLHKTLKTIAGKKRMSVNELIHTALEQYVAGGES
jgi:hypothetical protein